MNRLNIYQNIHKEQTVVSNCFIDDYMAEANDAQLKIYLFLIRMMSANLPTSVTDIADKFNYTEKDVLRALMYWESRQLLALEYDAAHNLSGIQVLSLDNPYEAPVRTAPRITPVLSFIRPASMQSGMTAPKPMAAASAMSPQNPMSARMNAAPASMQAPFGATATIAEYPVKEVASQPERPSYSMDDLKNFKKNEETQQLLFVTEQYLGRQLTRSDMETILFFYDRLGFSADLIDYLVQHCVERGKKDFRYMEKVALSWADLKIHTAEQAKQLSTVHNQAYYAVIKSLGISNRNLVPYEMDFIEKWMKEYGFTLDIITEACKRTIQAIHQPSFEYTDTILHSWKDNKIHHLEDIAVLDASYKDKKAKKHPTPPKNTGSKFNNFSQRNYNYDQLERQLLNRSIQ